MLRGPSQMRQESFLRHTAFSLHQPQPIYLVTVWGALPTAFTFQEAVERLKGHECVCDTRAWLDSASNLKFQP